MSNEIITIYTRPGCGPCEATKRELERQGITFREIALETISDEQRQAFLDAGFAQAPVVIAPSGDAWSGFRRDKIRNQ